MYEIVTNRTPAHVVTMLEVQLEACYVATSEYDRCGTLDASVISLASAQQALKRDQLRHYVTHSEDGYFLDIRFSHDEFHFVDAFSKWLSRQTYQELTAFPDLAELVVNQFRMGAAMETLPIASLQSYSDRWNKSLWLTIQAYKTLSRDLHEHYQQALKRWGEETDLP